VYVSGFEATIDEANASFFLHIIPLLFPSLLGCEGRRP